MSVTDRLTGLTMSAAVKIAVRTATTAAITLSALQTVDGVALASGDRVLVKNQADAADNGIYVADTGDWSRSKDFDGNDDVVKGTFVYVTSGATTVGYWRVTTDDPIIIDTDDVDWEQALVNDSVDISFTQAGTGAVARSLQSKMRDIVSVKDFGAVGDGVADDTAAIQTAIDSFSGINVHLFIPAGTYRITSALTVDGNFITIYGEGTSSILAPEGAINAIVIGDGITGVNWGTMRDFKIKSTDGLTVRGIWARWIRQFHFANILIEGDGPVNLGFTTASFQADYSWSCNFNSVTTVYFSGKGFWLGEDSATASNQFNDLTMAGCQAFVGDGIGFHLKGSGISLLGCLAEECDGGGVLADYCPGLNVSGGYYESNGATSGYSFYITSAQNAGAIIGVFINNSTVAGSQCIVMDDVDTFVVSGCNLRIHASGIGVELDSNVSNIYLIGNRNEGGTGTLYGGVSYPANAKISDEFVRFTDLFCTDITTDAANKIVYIGRLSATPGDATTMIVRSRQGNEQFKVDAGNAAVYSTAMYGSTVGGTNRDLYVDDTGLIGYVPSIREAKKNIKDLDDVSWLMDLRAVSFNRRVLKILKDKHGEKIGQKYLDQTYGEEEYGLIADEVLAVNPELCFHDLTPDGPKLAGVRYSRLIIPLLKAVQKLRSEVSDLKGGQ